MKKTLCVILCLLIFMLAFSACLGGDRYALTVDGVGIKDGIYAYYLDKALTEGESDEKAAETALQSCKEFAVTQSFMEKKNISVRAYFKRRTAEDTENIWGMFGEYYKNIGISKQDINAVMLHEYRKKELLHYYYGTDGLKPVSQDDLKEEFVDLYVGFKAIEGSLTKINNMGETVELTETEIAAMEKQFSSMASRINSSSATIDELNEEYNDSLGLIVTSSLPVILAKDGDPMYDDDFFKKVMDIPHGFARVVKSGSSIYVVLRETIATTDEDAFVEYSSEVLESMKMSSIEKKIAKLAEACVVQKS